MLVISISRKFEFSQCFSPPKGHETTRHWHEPEAKQWFLPYYGQTGMYGPPPRRKRKMKVTEWSAQMYSAFVGA
jgi:hypothetical protein